MRRQPRISSCVKKRIRKNTNKWRYVKKYIKMLEHLQNLVSNLKYHNYINEVIKDNWIFCLPVRWTKYKHYSIGNYNFSDLLCECAIAFIEAVLSGTQHMWNFDKINILISQTQNITNIKNTITENESWVNIILATKVTECNNTNLWANTQHNCNNVLHTV
jgi:hypothetical protein